jgi:O-antigen biosynthesis protein
MSKLPAVTVIILNWNGGAYLPACLAALLGLDYPDYRVVVVDNGSSDSSPEMVRRRFPQVELIENGCNRGFAAGNNVALRQLKTGYAVLLNPDVVVSPEWLRELMAPMVADPSIGIAGCKLTFPNGRVQHAGGFITAPQAFPGHYGLNEIDEGQHDSLRDVEYVTGAAMALARPLLNRIGLLDEGYFLYYEEVDFCWRARQAGFRVVYVPGATAVHDESALSQRGSPSYLEQMHSGRWRFLLKQYETDTVLHDTIPAERKWLAAAGAAEREAVQHAYARAIRSLPELFSHRLEYQTVSMNPSSNENQKAVADQLKQLYQDAKPPDDTTAVRSNTTLDLLQQKCLIQEQPFTSGTPLVAPLLSRLREVWNSVSTKWYVRPLLQQQNEFNQTVVGALQEHDARLHDHDARLHDHDARLHDHDARLQEYSRVMKRHFETLESWLVEQDRNYSSLAHDNGEVAAQLVQMNRLLQAINERLARLEADSKE